MNDQHRISLHNINTISNRQVKRMKNDINQGPVVRRPISTNPGLNLNPLLKSLFGIIFSVLFKASNSHTKEEFN